MRFLKFMCVALAVFLLCACEAPKNSTISSTDQPSILFETDSHDSTTAADDPTCLTEPTKHEIEERPFFSEENKPWIDPDNEHTQACVPDQIAATEIAEVVVSLLEDFSSDYVPYAVEFYDVSQVWVVSFNSSACIENPLLMIAVGQKDAQIMNIWTVSSDSTQSDDQEPWKESDETIPIPILPNKETAGAIAEIIQRAYARNDDYYPRSMLAQFAWYVQEEGYWVIYIYEDVDCFSSNTMTITFDEKDWHVVKKWVGN